MLYTLYLEFQSRGCSFFVFTRALPRSRFINLIVRKRARSSSLVADIHARYRDRAVNVCHAIRASVYAHFDTILRLIKRL